MQDLYLGLSRLSFGYPSAAGLLFEDLNCVFPPGWTGIVGFNGGGKSTLLRLAAGLLAPECGRVERRGRVFLCSQEEEEPPAELAALLSLPGREAAELRLRLRLGGDWLQRWGTLSYGERKRARIGCALFGAYGILCLDEPTNHLDRESAELLGEALREFHGIGLLVSHDRNLLDALCEHCLFLEPDGVSMRSGNWSAGKRQREIELDNRRDEFRREKEELRRRKEELLRRRRKEEIARSKNSKRKLDRHDHDGKGAIDAARVTGRSRTAGDLAARQRTGVERQAAHLAGLVPVREENCDFRLPGRRSGRNQLFSLPEGMLALGGGRFLTHPELRMASGDRIGVTGGNGLGKSTLVRRILDEIPDRSRIFYLPQEIPPETAAELAARCAALDRRRTGQVMRLIHNLGSSPERVLASGRLSPGELRKLCLALGVDDDTELVVMDEPTNHLDLPSVECLERALAGAECGLLLVSHDPRFLKTLARTRWHLGAGRLAIGYFD